MIEFRNVSKTFVTKDGPVEAMKNVNLHIGKGEIYGVIGLSGAGKSTFIRCVNQLERPTEGNVLIEGRDLSAMTEAQLREERKSIGMIFQHFNLLMQKTVLDNICLSMKFAGVDRKEAKERARQLLKVVDLEEKERAYPSQLSGGQKQRVAIARAIANNPKILLCDEATSALDPQTTKSVLQLLKKINHEFGITILVVTHEMSVVQEICDKVAILDHGRLVESGPVKEIFAAPKSQEGRRLIMDGRTLVEEVRTSRLIRIVFGEQSAFEPVIANMILRFRFPVNILYANTRNLGGRAVGEMILQLPDDEEQAKLMIDYLKERNLETGEVSEDVEAGN